jgi:hypothetical protein
MPTRKATVIADGAIGIVKGQLRSPFFEHGFLNRSIQKAVLKSVDSLAFISASEI